MAAINRPDERVEQLRAPPCSIEAEQAVLGGLMLVPDAYERVADLLVEGDFYRRDHQLIFRAIRELAEKNRPYDAVTLGEWFEVHRQSELVAGGAYLIELASTTPSAANIVAYAEIVRDKAKLRQLIEVGTNIVNDAFQPDGRETAEIITRAETSVLALGVAHAADSGGESGLQGLRRTYLEMQRRREAGSGLLGASSSLPSLDRHTLGFQDDNLIIIAARPSMGKSALAFQIMRHFAESGRRPYGISMEMSAEQVYMRHVAAVGRVDLDVVQLPARADVEQMERIMHGFKVLKPYQWWLDDTSSLSVDRICSRARRMKKQHDIGALFVDYLQFVDLSALMKHGVVTAIQDVTRKLKSLAKELHIPVVLLSQLNRSLETRTDKRPTMADLRESGAIEQDADVVIFIHREGYFQKDWAQDDPRQGVAELIAAKVRNGKRGVVTCRWTGAYQRFDEYEPGEVPADYEVGRRTSSVASGFEPNRHPNRAMMTGLTKKRYPGDND